MKYLFHGNDQFVSFLSLEEKINELISQYPNHIVERINCERIDPNLLVEKINTQNLFSKGQIIVLKRIYLNKEKDKILEELLFKDNSSSENIILFWEDQNIPSNTKYSKHFNEKNNILLNHMNKRSFLNWAKEICNKKNIRISSDGINILAERSNYDTEKFFKEIEKIELLELEIIDSKILIENITDTFEYTIWNLIDSMNTLNKQNTIKILESLFKSNTDPIYILTMLMRNYRQIILVKLLLTNNLDNKEICSKLKIPPFTLPSLKKTASDIDIKKLSLIYEKINNLDYEIKIGNIEPKLGITLLLSFIN